MDPLNQPSKSVLKVCFLFFSDLHVPMLMRDSEYRKNPPQKYPLQDMATVPTVLATTVARTVGSNASCHTHSLENATHLAGTGVQVLIYMGQMQPASSSIRWSVDARCDSHTDFHLQQKIEYKSCFHGNDYKKVVYLV